MEDNTFWWILQIQFPDKNGDQLELFESAISRFELLTKSIKLIPSQIRIIRGKTTWGIADLTKISDILYTFCLTMIPPNVRIAEESELGHLEDFIDPRYYTLCVINIQKQIVMVHKSPDVSRYARAASTFAEIFKKLIDQAVQNLNMSGFYNVEVDPLAEKGSFVEWVASLDELKKITITYAGANLPDRASNLTSDLKGIAKEFKSALKSRNVELVANNPHLDDDEVEELDKSVSERRLKLRARGIRSGVGKTWRSSEKSIPETAIMPLTEEQLRNTHMVATMINRYLNEAYDD